MLETISLVGVVIVAVLIWYFLKARSQDLLAAVMEKRRSTCKLVSRAEYAEGMNVIPVALGLSDTTLFYENPDMEASFELSRIDEIEYDDELATGRSVPDGQKALRLRSHGTAFEFMMPAAEIVKWQAVLPGHQSGPVTAKAV